MCLTTITKQVKRTSNKPIWAWKGIFRFRGQVFSGLRGARLVTGRWFRDPNKGFIEGLNKCRFNYETQRYEYVKTWSYPKGFHVVTTRKAAVLFGRPVRVRVRHVHTWGLQSGEDCMVAREIFIPRRRRRR